jgi:hypothetical protein
MSKEYDFDIQHYSIHDIENLFQLPKNIKYTIDDVKLRRREFYEKIIHSSSGTTNRTFIRKLNTFLDQACDLLSYFLRDGRGNAFSEGRRQSSSEYDKNHPVQTAITKYEIERTKTETGVDPNMVLDYHNNVRTLSSNNTFASGDYHDRGKHEVIPPSVPEFNMVMQNEFNPGKLNPIHTPVLTKCLNIDTRFRESLYTTQSSDFIFSLPTKIRKVVSMQLSAYEFPVTFYSTSQSYGNNYFNIFCTYNDEVYSKSMTIMRTIFISDGNYSALDLINKINVQLCPRREIDNSLLNNNLTGGGDLVYTGIADASGIFNCIQLSIDITDSGSGSGKVTLGTVDQVGYAHSKNITAIGLDFTLDKNGEKDLINITSKIGWNLGFIRPKYSGKTQYISDTLPDPAAIRYLYLVINDFNNSVNNHFVGAFNNWILNDNILARIPINGQYFNILMENQLSQHLEPRRYFGPVDIQRLQIQLLDDHGRVLDINNANYSLCLTFKCMYD